MKKTFSNAAHGIGSFWKAHRAVSVVIACVVVGGGYVGARALFGAKGAQTLYVLAAAEKGTIVTSVSGTGQVAASNQVDVKPQVSANVISVPVKQGQTVKAGTLLVQLDATDALRSVRNAQASLDNANISLQKLQEPPTDLELLQAQDAVVGANQSLATANANLSTAYESAFNAISNTFLDLPTAVTGLDSILNGNTLSTTQDNAYAYADLAKVYQPNVTQFRDTALASFQKAEAAYNANLVDYKDASRSSSRDQIDALLAETLSTTKTVSGALKDAKNFLDLVNNILTNQGANIRPPAVLATHENDLLGYTNSTNGDLSSLLSAQTSIQSGTNAIANASSSIAESQQSLVQLKAGTDPLNIQSAELSVEQAKDSLLSAEETLAEYSVRAPIAGTVAAVDVKVGDTASGGTAVATVISPEQIADVTLNEVDIAKVKVGQKATLTFDALPDLTVAGTVAQVDTIGTVTQGVVNYDVEIAFDTQESEVRPGMSVTADIVTDVASDVVTVPGSAVKTQGTMSYVTVVNPNETVPPSDIGVSGGVPLTLPPQARQVTTGASDDTTVQIVSGLNEGDVIVTQQISGSAATSASGAQTPASASRSGFGGGFGGGGAIFRAVGR